MEESIEGKGKRVSEPSVAPVALKEIEKVRLERTRTELAELDRVLGGGLVDGSLILLGGDPGIGKSTLMLQVAGRFEDRKVLYVSGEESSHQIKLRAERLRIDTDIKVLAETNLENILTWIERTESDLVIIDSIQTIYHPGLSGAPGSVGQVRECGNELMRMAKRNRVTMVLIGHVTKVGAIAGPKTLEHIVDTVLYFEGDRNQRYRLIRCFKNRFGSTNEVGVFEMTESGLVEVDNPSSIFLLEGEKDRIGSGVIAITEGTRSFLIEVQSLANPTYFNYPQRQASGINYRRLILLLAVIEQKLSLPVRQYDIFVNVVGGIRIDEPAGDFGVVLAIASAIKNLPIPHEVVMIGEVGLGGELRPVSAIEMRIREAERLGFKQCLVPYHSKRIKSGVEIQRIKDVRDGYRVIFGE